MDTLNLIRLIERWKFHPQRPGANFPNGSILSCHPQFDPAANAPGFFVSEIAPQPRAKACCSAAEAFRYAVLV